MRSPGSYKSNFGNQEVAMSTTLLAPKAIESSRQNIIKTFLKFCLIMIACQSVTYFIAGLVARFGLGAYAFYPPSPHALSYLRDPGELAVEIWMLPAQALRGFLFAAVLFPFRRRILELGSWIGGLTVAAILLVMGYVAASGGMIEHFVFFKAEAYPLKFAVITFIEIFIQALLIGLMVVWAVKKWVSPGGWDPDR
jgi:hypothetical protein